MNEIEKKITDNDVGEYISNQEFKKLTIDNFASRLKQANLASKNDTADFVKNIDFDKKLKNYNKKITSNKTKDALIQNEFKTEEDKIKITNIWPNLFIGQSYIFNDGLQNFLMDYKHFHNPYWSYKINRSIAI